MGDLLRGQSPKSVAYVCSRSRTAFLLSNSRSARGVNQTLLRVFQNRSLAACRASRVFSSTLCCLITKCSDMSNGLGTADGGSVFTSKYWGTICYHLAMKRRVSTAFHPQTDGQTERMNQNLESYLRCYYQLSARQLVAAT